MITWLRITATGAASPRLLWIGINAAPVMQRAHISNELLPAGTGEPDQFVRLSKTPIIAGRDFGVKVMGDNLAADDRIANARWMESLGVDFIIHHIGYDERRMITGLSPMDEIDEVVRAVSIPVQAVGGLTIKQAIECPSRGAPLVVLGAPLVIDANEFKAASGQALHDALSEICREIRRQPAPARSQGSRQ